MEVPLDQVFEILSMLAAILHLGNISFINAGGAQVSDKTSELVDADPFLYIAYCGGPAVQLLRYVPICLDWTRIICQGA